MPSRSAPSSQKVANVAVTTETAEATIIQTRHRIPETPLTGRPDPRLPGADPRAAALPRAARDRDAQDACARGIRADACQALRGHRPARPHRHDLCLSGQGRGPLRDGPLADAEIRQSEDAHVAGAAAVRRRPREAHLRHAALSPKWSASISRTIRSRSRHFDEPCALCGAEQVYLDEVILDDQGRAHVRLLRHRPLRERGEAKGHRGAIWRGQPGGGSGMTDEPLLRVNGALEILRRAHRLRGCLASSSGRAKCWRSSANPARARRRCSTASRRGCSRPRARSSYRMRDGSFRDLYRMSEAERRFLMRTDWGFVHQNPADGLRMTVSAGANVGERLMAVGDRHYGKHPRDRDRLARPRRDRRGPHRRPAARLLRRHAPAPADRPQPRHRPAARLHGRADRRPRRLGAGAAARPPARPGRRPRPRGRSSSPTTSPWRGCCRTA